MFKRGKKTSRLLAALLAVLMVISMLPLASAEGAGDCAEIVLTFKNDLGEIIPGVTAVVTVGEGTETTLTADDNGVLTVIAAGSQTVTDPATAVNCKFTADGYEEMTKQYDLSTAAVAEEVVLNRALPTIDDVEILGKTLDYSGAAQEAVSVTEVDGDVVTYKLDGEVWTAEDEPSVTDVKRDNSGAVTNYVIEVTVTRAGHKPLVKTVNTVVNPLQIEGIELKPLDVEYKEENGKTVNQTLVELKGNEANDVLSWTVNGTVMDAPIGNIPGDYTVQVTIDRGPNYEVFTSDEVKVTMLAGTLELDGLVITGLNDVYDGTAKDSVSFDPSKKGDYDLLFQLGAKDDGNAEPVDGGWQSEPVKVTEAGSYIAWVKAIKTNYNDANVGVANPSVELPFNVYIAKKPQSIAFNEYSGEESVKNSTEAAPFKETKFDFSIKKDDSLVGDVTYLVQAEDDEIATIDSNGTLTVNHPGTITVTAKLSGDDNHAECDISHKLVVTAAYKAGLYVSFEKGVVDYVIGTNGGVASELAATKIQNRDNGVISYSIPADLGLAIDENGKVTVVDYSKLIAALNDDQDHVLDVIVTANKAAEKYKGVEIYPADSASYVLRITFEGTPGDPFTLNDANEEGWYKDNVTVTPADGYEICLPKMIGKTATFASEVILEDEGTADRTVYLRSETTNGITAPIAVSVKIDKTKPANMKLEVETPSFVEKLLGQLFGFTNENVVVHFYVEDEFGDDPKESGVASVNWEYAEETDPNKIAKSGVIKPEFKDGKYTATLTLPKPEGSDNQLRGIFAFTATDVAGNQSDKVDTDGRIVVQDTISPTMKASFTALNPDTTKYQAVVNNNVEQHYYSDDVKFSITIDEDNFFTDTADTDVSVSVTRDGVKYKVEPEWSSRNGVNIGTFELNGNGDYEVTVSYTDDSGNDMLMDETVDSNGTFAEEKYISEIITIDKKDPTIEFDFDGIWGDDVESDNATQSATQSATLKITEHNFRSSDITVEFDATNIKGEAVAVKDILTYVQDEDNWTHNDDVHTLELKSVVDEGAEDQLMLLEAIYNMTFSYADLAQNGASVTGKFVVDHTAPVVNDLKIITPAKNYYELSIGEMIAEVITLGFYKHDTKDNTLNQVEVEITGTDNVSGIKSFHWVYNRRDGASNTNVEKLEGVLEDEEINYDARTNTFTATLYLPEKAAEQLDGALQVSAEDMYYNHGNASVNMKNGETWVDAIVIDNIAPNVKVEFSKPSRAFPESEDAQTPAVITDAYYNGNIDVTITVEEINFYPEDVEVTYVLNGDAEHPMTPNVEWDKAPAEEGKEAPKDTYIGKFTLTEDGHYVVNVKYKDKSDNFVDGVSDYTSHRLTIDTKKPVIDVEYKNNNVINKLTDSEEHERSYLDATQTATITLTEHNFDLSEVQFALIATDVTGQQFYVEDKIYSSDDLTAENTEGVCYVSEWTEDETGDVHYITVTYPGDANYTFDVAYTDLATNEALDRPTDYFTVDKTVPENLNVEYSISILETVLEALSFGFYNAKMTVTLSAEDYTGGVHSFNYSYINAKGVSKVNAQLLDQAIKAAAITYSDDALLATTTFDIPKKALGNDNQFRGTVEFTATDRSGNVSNANKEEKLIVVDNIAPTATITYNDPVNTEGTISYYDGDINATLTITEANFYAGDVEVLVSKNGEAPVAIVPTWVDESVDVHVGTFTLTEDGHYFITVNYSDKSSNKMETYTSDQMTIDTVIEQPTFKINDVTKKGEAGAYKKDVKVYYSYQDENFNDKNITLTRVNFASSKRVNDQFIKVVDTEKGGSSSFSIDKEMLNDGIYTLKIQMSDKANHTTDASVTFTVNRFGSVYRYNDALVKLIDEVYTKNVTEPLEIIEYNADELLAGSLNIIITRDGETVEHSLKADPSEYNVKKADSEGWYKYVYTLDQKLFAEDGVYKISLVSSYATEHPAGEHDSTSVPENSFTTKDEPIKGTISFVVDHTAPEIRNVVNMEKSIVDIDKISKDGKLNVPYTIVDVGGLKSIIITVNGGTVAKITKFGDDLFSYSGNFDIMESNSTTPQKVVIEVVDLAGNVTSTDTDDFRDAEHSFVFKDNITVSRNFFVRWYANKLLFWGSIGGVIILAAAIWFFIASKNKKKAESK